MHWPTVIFSHSERCFSSQENVLAVNSQTIHFLSFLFSSGPFKLTLCVIGGRRGGLMVSTLDSGVSAPGSRPGRGHCVVFLGKTLYSHGASLHPGV